MKSLNFILISLFLIDPHFCFGPELNGEVRGKILRRDLSVEDLASDVESLSLCHPVVGLLT
jgi:hypothetical protein